MAEGTALRVTWSRAREVERSGIVSETQNHRMQYVRTLASGGTEWRCDSCTRRVYRPGKLGGEDIVLEVGDPSVTHAPVGDGRVSVRINLLDTSLLNEQLREAVQRAVAKMLEDMERLNEQLYRRGDLTKGLQPYWPPLAPLPPEQPTPTDERPPAADTLAPWLRWMRDVGLAGDTGDTDDTGA